MPSKPTRVETKHRGVKWRIQICVGNTRESHTAPTKQAAMRWALDREAELSSGAVTLKGRTFGDAFERYAKEVSPSKKGARWEIVRLNKLKRDPIAAVSTQALSLRDAERFRERALETLAPSSVARELTIIKTVARYCVKWAWMSSYPFEGLSNPKIGRVRKPIYTPSEIAAIKEKSGLPVFEGDPPTKIQQVGILFLLAIETGMRLSEMTTLTWRQVQPELRLIELDATKNGDEREVALSGEALALLETLSAGRSVTQDSKLFTVNSSSASTIFRKIRIAAGIEGKTFHRSRHTGITLLAKKLEPFELARQVGHRNINQTLEYFQASAEDLARKL